MSKNIIPAILYFFFLLAILMPFCQETKGQIFKVVDTKKKIYSWVHQSNNKPSIWILLILFFSFLDKRLCRHQEQNVTERAWEISLPYPLFTQRRESEIFPSWVDFSLWKERLKKLQCCCIFPAEIRCFNLTVVLVWLALVRNS